MNKKYLSVILFSALMLGTTGTFTSCKDYDDDINQINKELTYNKSAISELQSKVDNGKYVTNITKEGEGIKITWNDNSTSVIETIKGDKGADGTIVTIIDGYWAFDGVKSEYPAVGKDGADGADGQDGQDGQNGQDGHDAKISEDGYWMVWDAEKGEYAKTEYIAGGVTAVETAGGWNLTVRDENGDVQTIFIPTSSTMGYMDILNGGKYMNALYGINEKDVTYGPNDKVLAKGLYTTLDRDLMIVVNPQGTDASAYEYSLMNSANVNTGLLFKDAVPYEGVLDINDVPATRATSENAIWKLPHDFTRYEDIDDARTKNYLLFKANDGQYPYALSLTATLNNTTVKTPYDLGAKLKKIGNVKVTLYNLTNCAVNTKYEPVIKYVSPSVDAAAVYDYWLTFEQSADNLKDVALYGAEIVDEGHKFVYKRETGVNNSIKLLFNYILMDGTVVEGKDAVPFVAYMKEEMASSKEITLDRLNVPMDAKYVDGENVYFLNGTRWGAGGQPEFALNTKPYSLAKLLSEMSDVEKAVWNSAIENRQVSFSIIGGEGDNNEDNQNFRRGYNVLYAFNEANDEVIFQFLVSAGYPVNFKLKNAYQLTMTVNDEDTNTPVASIVLPFEFTMPTLGITRVKSTADDKSVLWTKDADNNDVLKVYGERGTEATKLPNTIFGDLRDAFTGAFDYEKGEYVATLEAGFYDIYVANVGQDKVLLGQFSPAHNPVTLADITTSSLWSEWNTWQNLPFDGADFATMEAEKVVYNHFGVYQEELPMFYVQFASKIEDGEGALVDGKGEVATPLMAQPVYNGSELTAYEVIINDANFDMKDAFGYKYYMFDSVTVKDGKAVDTKKRNALNNMWANDREGLKDDSNTYYGLNPTAKVDGNPAGSLVKFNLLTWNGGVWPTDGTYATQMKITIDKSVAAAKNNLVEVTLNVTDVFGHVYELPIYIQTVK